MSALFTDAHTDIDYIMIIRTLLDALEGIAEDNTNSPQHQRAIALITEYRGGLP